MKLEKLSLIDDQFVTAEIAANAGTISLEAEVRPVGPIHIEHAIWNDSGVDAMSYVARSMASVRAMIEEALPKRA